MSIGTDASTPLLADPRAWHDIPIGTRGTTEKVSSVNQEMLWLRWLDLAGDPAFTISTTIRLPGRIDRAAFRHTYAAVADRQPTLRTAFQRNGDSTPVPRTGDGPPVPVHFEELPPSIEPDALARHTSEWARQPFELVGGEPARVAVFQLGDEAAVVQVAMHHAFTDWVSMQALLRDVAEGYAACIAGRPCPAAQPGADYGDFAWWERDLLGRGGWRDDIDYWRPRFTTVPPPLWSRGADRAGPLDLSAGRRSFDLPLDAAEAFARFARRQRVTTFMAVLGLYRILLHWATGREDVVVGVPASARVRPEIEELVGYFLNLVPLHGSVAPQRTVAELLADIRAQTIEDMRHATVSTGALYRAFAPEACPWRALPFQARLIFLSSHEGLRAGAGTGAGSTTGIEVQTGAIPYDLTLALWAVPGAMFGRFDYRQAVFEAEDVARLEDALRCLLRIVPLHEDRPVAEVVRAADECARRRTWHHDPSDP